MKGLKITIMTAVLVIAFMTSFVTAEKAMIELRWQIGHPEDIVRINDRIDLVLNISNVGDGKSPDFDLRLYTCLNDDECEKFFYNNFKFTQIRYEGVGNIEPGESEIIEFDPIVARRAGLHRFVVDFESLPNQNLSWSIKNDQERSVQFEVVSISEYNTFQLSKEIKEFNITLVFLTNVLIVLTIILILITSYDVVDRLYLSKPNIKVGFYIPHPHDNIKVRYCTIDGKCQDDFPTGSDLLNIIVFDSKKLKIKNSLKDETICFGIRIKGRRLNGVSCYITDPDRDKKIKEKEEDNLIKLDKYNRNWKPTKIEINPKNDVYVYYDRSFHPGDVIVLPLKFTIKKLKIGKYNIRFELSSKNMTRVVISNLQLVIN